MQNNESFSTMDTTQASETTVLSDLPDSVKEELIETVSTLKNLLDGNQEFFPKLISKSFEVAIKKNINMTDVEKLLYTEYPDLTNYEDTRKIFLKYHNIRKSTLNFI